MLQLCKCQVVAALEVCVSHVRASYVPVRIANAHVPGGPLSSLWASFMRMCRAACAAAQGRRCTARRHRAVPFRGRARANGRPGPQGPFVRQKQHP